jgi:glycosyltransferase involved in cell wall biosynthesis
MLEGARVIVLVPAFREEAHVGRVLRSMPPFVDHTIVIDDGSDDRTGQEADAAARADRRMRVLRHDRRRGVGAALVTGYLAALEIPGEGRDAFCVMAGDGQMDPSDLRDVALPVVRGEAGYVKGNRFGYPGVRRTMGLPRWIGGQVFSRLTSLAIAHSISDSQCGFTALSRTAAQTLDLPRLWPSFGYPNDLLAKLAERGVTIREVPVRPIYGTEESKLGARHLPAIFFLLIRAAVRRRTAERGRRKQGKGEHPPSPNRVTWRKEPCEGKSV